LERCYIVAYGRSPIAKASKGSLASVNPVDFGAEVLKGVLKKIPQLENEEIDDIIAGCAIPEGQMGLNIARNIVLRAGLSDEVSGQTVNRFCASGLQSIATGASMIISNMQDVVVAGGVESMTCPVISSEKQYLNNWLLENTDNYVPMGITAENVAQHFQISRKQMEEFAVESNAKAAKAVEGGVFDNEIIPVKGIDKEGNEFIFERDECYRKGTNMETLSTLKPCFKEDGLVTAATSSQRSDGAGFVVLMSGRKLKELGLKPIAEFISYSVAGLDPSLMGLGPIYAVKKIMMRTRLNVNQMDVIELNEAFASQTIASVNELGLDKMKVNPRGALGHPLGASGAILTCKAINYLKSNGGRYGLVTMCIGGGMGAAMILEIV
jgi:acetyl-CoA acyltransferase